MTKEELRARIKADMIELAKQSYCDTADISKLFTKEDKININFSGQSNKGYIKQYGHSNKSFIVQSEHSNNDNIHQDGHSNEGYIRQDGHSNKSYISQQSHSNKGYIHQYNHFNIGYIYQDRHSNYGDIFQQSHSNNGRISQQKHSNKGHILQNEHSNEGNIYQSEHSNNDNEYNSDYAIVNGKKYDAITLDGFYSVIVEDKRRNGIGVFKDNDGRFVATNGIISYHSYIDYDDAKAGLKNKKKRLMEDLGKWVKTLKPNSKITRELFHEETGSCMPGIENWCKKVGISKETKSITFKKFKELAIANPTMETQQVMNVLELLKENNEN